MTFSGEWRVESGEWMSAAAQSAAARRLLAEVLHCDYVVVEHDDRGAPYLPAYPSLHISISHCRNAVAVAVSDKGPVGIDIECRRRIGDGLAGRVCSPDEQQVIRSSADPTMEFLHLWTRKEAVLKCRRTGIRGFESMVQALQADDIEVDDVPCGVPDTVAALAVIKA